MIPALRGFEKAESEVFCRFADVGPTQNADRERVRVTVRVRRRVADGFREACAVTGSLEPEDGRAALGRALELAELSPVSADRPALGGPVEVPAMAALWLATDDEAAGYNGQHFMAQEFVRQRGLWEDWESVLPMNRGWSPTAILDWREPRRR